MNFKREACRISFLVLAAALAVFNSENSALAENRAFQMVTVEIEGTKIWLPSTIVVKKGDQVKIKATSKVPGTNSIHGFTIDAFKVVDVADEKGKEITFTANKSGIFPIRCHLHPTHIGAQLLVLE